MEPTERDREMLNTLSPDERAEIEDAVAGMLDEAPDDLETSRLLAAADAFDDWAETLPDDRKVAAWMMAGALRKRASVTIRLH